MASLSDLVTIEQVRAFVEPQGTTRDALLADFITRASRLTRSETRRRFTKPPFVGERRFYLQQSRYIHTDDPVASIAYVRGEGPYSRTVDGEPVSLYGVTDLDYRAPDPEDPEQQLDPMIVLEQSYTGPVVVSASFGWTVIPEDVQQAVITAVGIWYERDVAHFTTTFELDERRVERPEALPSAARGMLDSYRLQGAGVG